MLQHQEKKKTGQKHSINNVAAHGAISVESRLSVIQKRASTTTDKLTATTNMNKTSGHQPLSSRPIRHSYLLPSFSTQHMPSMANFGNHPPLHIRGSNDESDSQMSGVVMSQLTMNEFGSHSQVGGDMASVTSNSQHSASNLSILHQSSNHSAATNENTQRYQQNNIPLNASVMRASSSVINSSQMAQSSNSAMIPFHNEKAPNLHHRGPVLPRTPARQQRSWMTTITPHQKINTTHRQSLFATPMSAMRARVRTLEQPNQHTLATPKIDNGRSFLSIPNRSVIKSNHMPKSDDEKSGSGTSEGEFCRSPASEKSSFASSKQNVDSAEVEKRLQLAIKQVLEKKTKELEKTIASAHKLCAEATKKIETLTEIAAREQKHHLEQLEAAKNQYHSELERSNSDVIKTFHDIAARDIELMAKHSASLRNEDAHYRRNALMEEKGTLVRACLTPIRKEATDFIKIALGSELVISTVQDLVTSMKDSAIDQLMIEARKIFSFPGFGFGRSKRIALASEISGIPPPAKKTKRATGKKRGTPAISPPRRSKRIRSFKTDSAVGNPPPKHCVTPFGTKCTENPSAENRRERPIDSSQSPESCTVTTKQQVVAPHSVDSWTMSESYSNLNNLYIDNSTHTPSTLSSSDDVHGHRNPRKLEMLVFAGDCEKSEDLIVSPSAHKLPMVPCTPNSKSNSCSMSEMPLKPIRSRSAKCRRKGPTYQRTQNRRVHLVEDCFSFLDY
jgi:hypothetical protein